jgi:alkanesulfonate monooxygenase SsuD/methylene tetrahydromethanopterin reductase-like flavin-dependent oxidoreductase (luciferase family)
VQIDLLFDPFGATWHDVQEGAIAAEGEGFDGVWMYDHLAGSVHGQQRALEVALMLPSSDVMMGLFDIARSARPERLSSGGRRRPSY